MIDFGGQGVKGQGHTGRT